MAIVVSGLHCGVTYIQHLLMCSIVQKIQYYTTSKCPMINIILTTVTV